jgi:hypothetical protein
MTKMTSIACAAVMAAFATTSIVPATAAPVFVPQNSSGATDVIQVQDGYKWRKRNFRKGNNWQGDNFRRDGNYAWYNGKRGYRYKRDGYRYHNGFWFPAGAFVVGALVGSAIANSNSYAGGSAHVEWCYDRYRSYRAYDNTFQPYNGSRQQCYSPYS